MAENSDYVLEPLREGVDFTLYRGVTRGNQIPVLAVAVTAEQPSPQSLRRLEHEYSLASEFGPAWAAKPLALTRHEGRTILVLADPGGEPLDLLLGKPMELTQFLRTAIGVSAALRQMHGCGFVHKDIKPTNILADRTSGEAWLTGFGIASRLPRERQAPAPPESIAGTLAYMAPEQTGRMNRSIDSRSDLYSFGVTLYQMLTGSLPFTASNPMEWVHCHIARKVLPPKERLETIPLPVSNIIMRLLAKNAEERYQSAAGVERDLGRCLSEWEAQDRISDFSLGENDIPDRLMIPEKLYGRDREIETLLNAFDRIVAGGRPELVLVSGYSGIGKSAVVNELHKPLVPPRGLFASGKFDQYKRDIPYATLAQAFQSLIRPLLSKGEEELRKWRDALHEALDPNGLLIVELVPELKHIIGEQPPVPELPPKDAQGRFQLIFRRFISVFARPESPLALFLDDLQWLDAATLDLLEDLLSRTDMKHLLLIGAYRDNEVNSTHPLMRKLDAMRQAGSDLHDIVLAPLGLEDLNQLLADSLRCERDRAAPLAQLLHEKTYGNPFFAIQFISSLADEGLLNFDHGEARWSWDLNRIHAKGYTDNVVDLMVGKLNRLPAATQTALQQFACMGNSAEFDMIHMVYEGAIEEMHDQLWEAVRAGLVFRSEKSYRFLHDRVQEAAYSLIPKEQRAAAHLRIGTLLAENTPPERLEDIIFEIVNQLNRGSHLITSVEERERVAELNLIAGRHAKLSTAYASALKYLRAGRALLTDTTWERNYRLIFSIEYLMAECELLTADMAASERRLSLLSQRTRNPHDFAIVTRLQLTLYTTLDQSDRGVDVFLEYLRRTGTDWARHPTREDVLREYDRIWASLGNRSIEQLIDIPLITDSDVLDILDVLTEIVTPALYFDENLSSLVVCRMVNLSLEHGNHDGSCFGYVWLGVLAGPRFNNYKDGFRFGRLGYDLVEKRGLVRYQARTYMSFGNFVVPWTEHVSNGRDLVRRAFDAAYGIGDLTFAAYSLAELIKNSLMVGVNLADVQTEAENALEFARRTRFGLVIEVAAAQLGLIRMLRGLTTDFGSLNDGEFDELASEHYMAGNPVLAFSEFCYFTRKLQGRFFAGDYTAAVDASRRAHSLLWPVASQIETGDFRFYSALAHAALFRAASSDDRPVHFKALMDHHAQLKVWAEHCPANFENREALVAAELAQIEGHIVDSEELYEKAIRSAHLNGFIHNEAVAYELAAQFYRTRGFKTIADAYLRNARHCYLRWGADGKVQQLDSLYPRLAAPEGQRPATIIGTPVQHLDVASVVKASQALSSEMVLPGLIERLMRIALEHAGAERGLLILVRDGEHQIEAEATADSSGIEVAIRQAQVTKSDLPQSALHYVLRTQKDVLLDDALADNVYSKDEYVQRKGSRSVLCLPIVRRGKLVGALYLENNLAPFVFTPDRVTVLQLLASQAAISLENAALYSDLQLQAGLLQRLPVSAWTLKPDGTPDFVNQVWLEFSGQTLDLIRSHPEAWMTVVHPQDREAASRAFRDGVRSGRGFALETRSLRAQDGTYRWHLQQAVVLRDAEGRVLRFVGTTTDIDDQKRAEEALRQAQSDLARVNRITTMGELTASLAHEVSQPISGAMINANICLRKLGSDRPDLEEVRAVVTRFQRDAQRAADIIGRIRSRFEKDAPNREVLDVNEVIRDTVAVLRSEAVRYSASIRTELAADLPQIAGDRVQLQQVAMNLIFNSIEAMKDIDGMREVVIRSQEAEHDHILVSVSDTGIGLPPQLEEQIFDPFFTTKPHGTGMGLRISRSIIESHGGRLWATAHDRRGATFAFSIPSRYATEPQERRDVTPSDQSASR
ncbi:MAG: AAA family ATPase [Arenicellales bacterium]